MKKLFSIILLVILMTTLSACVDVAIDSTGGMSVGINSDTSSNVGAGETKTAATVGESVTGDDWKISFVAVKQYDSIGDNLFVDTPAEGKKFLVLFFDVENISSQNDYFDSYNIMASVDEYTVTQVYLSSIPEFGFESSYGAVAAGKKLRAYAAYEVPADWKEIEFSYEEDMWTGSKLTFKATADQISQ